MLTTESVLCPILDELYSEIKKNTMPFLVRDTPEFVIYCFISAVRFHCDYPDKKEIWSASGISTVDKLYAHFKLV